MSRQRHRDLRRRAGAVLAAAVLTAVLTGGLAAPAAAQPPPPTPPPPAATPIALDGVPPGTHEITLISGDKVVLTGVGNGRFTWRTEPATRPDGRVPLLHGTVEPDGAYLIPEDALPAVRSGVLDRNLFNVTYLAENGYTDADTDRVPVIAQYPKSTPDRRLRTTADAVPASVPGATLESINANELTVPKADAATFWQSVTGGGERVRALRGGLRKLWLDQKVSVSLSESVPLVGAPQAWAAGLDGSGVRVAVLDTGIDATHPDLRGKVAASASFVSDTVVDGHGHGTHVASTVAGTGAASDGRRTGVAPGAELAIGKVLDDTGSGPTSGVIEGMEWAAQQAGADIVSLSLGAGPTDGSDPASQAVDSLTASTGALFVIAAGNKGPGPETVASPGAARSALTVAATTKEDGLAGFSSRGPRLDGALKPDIAAPGQHIVAARAAGTSLCADSCVQPGDGPVDDGYTSASGTSMASPHVAGAAAILAQKYPDWSPERYKAALMSTAADAGHTVYEQGAGRLDVARAVAQRVHAATAGVDFGRVDAGQPPSSRTLTYTNLGDQPVTLTLTAGLRNIDGAETPDVLTLPDSVTVPAGASESVTVAADTARLDEGVYSGTIVATAAGVRLSTPVGLVREPPKVTVELNVPAPPTPVVDGARPHLLYGIIDVVGHRGPLNDRVEEVGPGRAVATIPPGTYQFTVSMTWTDTDLRRNGAFLVESDVEISADTTITFDGRDAEELTFSSPRGPVELSPAGSSILMTLTRTVRPGDSWISLVAAAAFYRFWATPTGPVTNGELLFSAHLALGHPEVELRVRGRHRTTLHPLNYPHRQDRLPGLSDYRHFEGRQRLEVVDVGHAAPEDLAGLDLRGKLALLDNDRLCSMTTGKVHRVRDAGAAGILAWSSMPQNTTCGGGPIIPMSVHLEAGERDRTIGIPFTSIPPREARNLRAQLAKGSVTVELTGTPDSPYRYLVNIFEDGVPDSLHYRLDRRRVAELDMEFHGTEDASFALSDTAFPVDQTIGFAVSPPWVDGPTSQSTYVGPLDDDVLHLVEVSGPNGNEARAMRIDRPSRTVMRWNTGARTPGPMAFPADVLRLYDKVEPGTYLRFVPCHFCRQDNRFVASFTAGNGDGRVSGLYVAPGTTRLYRDGVEVPAGGPPTFGYTLPEQRANYRLTLDHGDNAVEWTFRSAAGGEHLAPGPYACLTEVYEGRTGPCRPQPLVFLAYDLGASQALDNTVSAYGVHRFTVRAFHSPSTQRMPAIAGARLWTSTDDGKTWQRAWLKRSRHGGRDADQTFHAIARYPRGATGTVSLKAEAWDTDGNRVTQVTRDAFRLR